MYHAKRVIKSHLLSSSHGKGCCFCFRFCFWFCFWFCSCFCVCFCFCFSFSSSRAVPSTSIEQLDETYRLRWTILWSGGVSDATLFSQCFVALVEAEYRQSRLWPFECKSLFLTIISREPRIGSKTNYQYSTRRVAESTSSFLRCECVRMQLSQNNE